MRRRGEVSNEEAALWRTVTRSVKPLKGKRPAPEPASPGAKRTSADAKRMARAQPKPPADHASTARHAPVAKTQLPASLDRRARQRLARGCEPIDARLDLHGRTQHAAHSALLRFLKASQDRGARTVLVITGKGRAGDSERGVLKRQVPLWLALPEFRALVVGFADAGIGHGGEGALYVQLRRGR